MAIILPTMLVVASIYYPGDGFTFNRHTASGHRYAANELTCAHRSLPFGTHVLLRRGHSLAEVVINDRGPFVRGRTLDCTPAVAKALHFGGLGSLHMLPYPPLPQPRPESAQ